MRIIFFTLLILFGLIIILKVNSRSRRISIYNKINSRENKSKETNNDTKDKPTILSDFIKLPVVLSKILYLKVLIVIFILSIITILAIFNIVNINQKTLLTIGLLSIITTLYAPRMIIKNALTKRTNTLLKSLPFFIDITAACVQSGMTIENSLNYTTQKFQTINTDLCLIMSKVTKRAEINGLENAIKELQYYSPAIEMKMFCSTLQYSLSFGSTVYEQLTHLSQDMREMQLLMTEESISKLSTKLTLPLFLFILIPFVLLVISPSILELLNYVKNI